MNKELQISKVMKDDGCNWDEAVKKIKQRKNLKEFF